MLWRGPVIVWSAFIRFIVSIHIGRGWCFNDISCLLLLQAHNRAEQLHHRIHGEQGSVFGLNVLQTAGQRSHQASIVAQSRTMRLRSMRFASTLGTLSNPIVSC